jgi:hypothetical protein
VWRAGLSQSKYRTVRQLGRKIETQSIILVKITKMCGITRIRSPMKTKRMLKFSSDVTVLHINEFTSEKIFGFQDSEKNGEVHLLITEGYASE